MTKSIFLTCPKCQDEMARAVQEIQQLRELLREVLMDDDSNVDAAVGLTYGLVDRIRSALRGAASHDSDCAVHNAPALPIGACTCKT